MQKIKLKWLSILMVLIVSLLAGCGASQSGGTTSGTTQAAGQSTASDGSASGDSKAPLAKYDEVVTLTAGMPISPNIAKLPQGDTAEDNGYTRHFFELSNIKIEYAFEADATSDAYDQKVKLVVASNSLPDFMVVHDYNLFKQMVNSDQLEDLTTYYQDYASPLVKGLYESGGNLALKMATFDGKLMAIPDNSIDCNTEYEVWLRQDWLDALGLQPPKTVDDIFAIAKAFAERDPDGNAKADTIGLTGHKKVLNALNGLDLVFHSYNSYPQLWLKDSSGKVVYGAVAPETKNALTKLSEMYAAGAIDKEFAIRNDPNENIISGKAGMFFGPFWAPMATSDSVKNDPKAEWKAYAAPLDANGKLNCAMAAPARMFLVVKKGCEHPDAVIRYFNWNIRYGRFEDPMLNKIYDSSQTDLSNNLDFTPIDFVLDYSDALDRKFVQYTDVLNGKASKDSLDNEGKMNIDWFNQELANPKQDTLAWGQYYAYMIGGAVLANNPNLTKTYGVFYGQTKTMETKWASLEKLENESMLKIIMGQEKPDYFDTFVKQWYALGGEQITAEVEAEIK